MKYFTTIDGVERQFEFRREGDSVLAVETREDGSTKEHHVDLSASGDGAYSLIVGGRCLDCLIERDGSKQVVQVLGERIVVQVEDERERAAAAVAHAKGGGKQFVEAAMPGIVVEVMVTEGEQVTEGQTLVVLEAMKMQNPMVADSDGVVGKVHCAAGEAVAGGALLLEVEPLAEEGAEATG